MSERVAYEATQNETSRLVFYRTGEPWLDLGITALWRKVQAQLSVTEAVRAELHEDRLELEGPKNQLLHLVNTLRDDLVNWPAEGRRKSFKTLAGECLLGHQRQGDFPLPFEHLVTAKRSGVCYFCGQSRPLNEVGTTHHPLLVGSDNMLSPYPEASRVSYRACSECLYAGIVAATAVWYAGRKQKRGYSGVIFIPEVPDLRILDAAIRLLRNETIPNFYRNYRPGIRDLQEQAEPTTCYLALLLGLLPFRAQQEDAAAVPVEERVHELLGSFSSSPLSQTTFWIVSVEKQNNVVTLRNQFVAPDPASDIELLLRFNDITREGRRWNTAQAVLNQFVIATSSDPNNPLRVLLREQLSRALLRRTDPTGIVATFLWELDDDRRQKLNLVAFERFVNICAQEIIHMTNEELIRLRSVGRTIGQIVAQEDDKEVMYRLRNARGPNDLLEALHRLVARHTNTFIEEGLRHRQRTSEAAPSGNRGPVLFGDHLRQVAEDITVGRQDWKQVRHLLGIYANLDYIRARVSNPLKGEE